MKDIPPEPKALSRTSLPLALLAFFDDVCPNPFSTAMRFSIISHFHISFFWRLSPQLLSTIARFSLSLSIWHIFAFC